MAGGSPSSPARVGSATAVGAGSGRAMGGKDEDEIDGNMGGRDASASA